MLKHLLTSAALLLSITVYSQSILVPEWSKVIEKNSVGKAQGWGVDLDSEGNVYWAPSLDSTGTGLDIYGFKYDAAGVSQWPTPLFFGGPGTQQAYVCNAKADHFYIGGKFCLISGFDCDMQLLKADKTTGALLWDETYDFGNSGYDEVDGLEIRTDGIYCAGWAQAIEAGPYRNEIGLWKLDFDGNTEWTNYIGQAGSSEHQDGHMVIDDDFIFMAGLYGGSGLFNLYNGYAFLGKFDRANGNLVDSVLFGYQSSDAFDIENALGMTSDGTHLYITGYTTPPGSDNWQLFLSKFDKSLNELWTIDWGGSGTETARAIAVANGRVYVGGVTESPEYSVGGQDGLLVQFDTDGNYIKHETWGDSLNDAFHDLVVSNDAVYISGSVFAIGDPAGVAAFLLKADDGVAFLNDPQAVEVTCFPNPANTYVQFKVPGTIRRTSVFDYQGRLVALTELKSLETSDLPEGIYWFEGSTRSGLHFTGKFTVVH